MSDWNETAVGDFNLNESDKQNEAKPLTEVTKIQGQQAKERAETAAKMKARGWVETTKYDYDLYAATGPQSAMKDGNGPEHARAEDGPANGNPDIARPAWAGMAVKYEWNDEFGDVGPAVPQLEAILFNNEYVNRKGNHIESLNIPVTIESQIMCKPIAKFQDAGLHPIVLKNVELCKYDVPTPIQAYCIPAILKSHDVIAVAQTGSGKTAAYLIPILSKLMGKAKKLAAPRPNPTENLDLKIHGTRAEPLVLIVVPTRELAIQIFDDARRLCYRSMLRPCVAYGGASPREQADDLRRGCDILIGTPGRLVDFMGRGGLISFRRVRYTVIDEADELVGDDWMDEMNKLMSGGDSNQDADHRYMFFSATFPKEARELARVYLDDNHVRIRVGRTGSTHKNIHQNIIECSEENKRKCLRELLLSSPPSRTIIFVNNKKAADLLDDFLYNHGMPSTSIHSDRTQREREDAIHAFKNGKAPILVTTGVSARGLDIVNVMHVINYDLPSPEHGGITEYVHRIGRTARIGQTGIATSFFSERNEDIAHQLVNILIESQQPVPRFLEPFAPLDRDAPLDFGDESEQEEETALQSQATTTEAVAEVAEQNTESELAQPSSSGGETWGGQQATVSGYDPWAQYADAQSNSDPSPVW